MASGVAEVLQDDNQNMCSRVLKRGIVGWKNIKELWLLDKRMSRNRGFQRDFPSSGQ
jgi:hypothetical protein